MKCKYTILMSAIIAATTGFAIAKAPEIERGRIDSMVAQVLKQGDNTPPTPLKNPTVQPYAKT